MLTSANTCRTGRSVLEAAVGQPVVHFEDLRLATRVLASEGEETDFITIQIHFTTNEAAGPYLTQRPGLPQQGDFAAGVAPPQVDQEAPAPLLQVELPVGGGRTAGPRGARPRRPPIT